MASALALQSKRMVTPYELIRDGIVIFKNERIIAVGTQDSVTVPSGAQVVDCGNDIIAPGLMDIHCHGYFGGQAGESAQACLKLARFLVRSGTTSFLPTIMVAQETANVAKARRLQKERGIDGADMVGINMEGPFLEPKKVEGVDTGDDDLPLPDLNLLDQILKDGEGGIRVMGLGILLPGIEKVVCRLQEAGIVVSVAHTKANAQQFEKAMHMGYTHATHLYNVMTGLHHRRPGVVGGFLSHEGLTAELISDNLHLHPWAVEIAIRCMGPDRLAIVTDLTLAGCEDGEYEINLTGSVIPVVVKDGIVRIRGSNPNQDNTMAGCTVMMNQCLRCIVEMGYPLHTAFEMATLTPARIIGMDRYKGSLEYGKDADIIVVDDDINVKAAYVRGEKLFET